MAHLPTKADAERFWRYVTKRADGCWLWLGAKNPQAQGVFRFAQRNMPAHHFAMLLHGLHVERGQRVSWRCPTAGCVNPAHSYVRTPKTVLLERRTVTASECWEWPGHKILNGYGITTFGDKPQLVHRLSFSVFLGDVPAGMCVLHRCDNRLCYNPAHLFLGSKTDNNADRHAKERTAHGELIARTKRGERNAMSKLSAHDIMEIRRRISSQGASQKAVAHDYRVSPSHISNIVRRKVWTHI